MPRVGSSSAITAGRAARIAPRATRSRWPTERSSGWRPASPPRSRASSVSATRARRSGPGGASRRSAKPTSSSTRSVRRCRPGSWPTSPTAGKRRSAGTAVASLPPSSTRPASGGCSPASTRSRVLLPEPLGPRRVVTWPARSSMLAPRRTTAPGWPASTASRAASTSPGGAGSGGSGSGGSGPAGSRRPPRTVSARPATARTRSCRCSASTTAVPSSAASRRSTSPSAAAAASSSCEVGSSISSTGGRAASTAARATRWRSPPESVAIARPARWPAPARASASRTRSGIAAAGTPALSRPKATSRATAPSTAWPSGSWKTIPARRAIRAGGVARVSCPATVTRPEKRPPWKWGTRPHSARSSVNFPSPEGPSSSSTSPAASSRSTPSRAGASAPP